MTVKNYKRISPTFNKIRWEDCNYIYWWLVNLQAEIIWRPAEQPEWWWTGK